MLDVYMLLGSEDIFYFGLFNFFDYIFVIQLFEFVFEQDILIFCEDELVIFFVLEFFNVAYVWFIGDMIIVIEVGLDSLYSLIISMVCEMVVDIIVIVIIDCDISICMVVLFNIFILNGDNINDIFGLLSDCEELVFLNFLLCIYNCWGNLVYEMFDVILFWDGEQDGEFVFMEVYFYFMQYQVEWQEVVQILQGDVMLVW